MFANTLAALAGLILAALTVAVVAWFLTSSAAAGPPTAPGPAAADPHLSAVLELRRAISDWEGGLRG